MTANQILDALLHANLLSLQDVIRLLAIDDIDLSETDIANILRGPYEPKYLVFTDYVLLTLLDELIIDKRGARDDAEKVLPQKTAKLSFNEVLKKLRIAFNLQEQEVREALKLATIELSKSDLSALFRKPNHPLYKACDAELLQSFIEGVGLLRAARSAE